MIAPQKISGKLIALMASFLCSSLPLCSRAQTNIPITNGSFEDPVVNFAPYYTNNGGVSASTPGWSGNGGVIYIPGGAGVWGFNTPASDGNQIAYLNGAGAAGISTGAFAQQLSSTAQAGTYTLSAFFGSRLDQTTDLYGIMELYAGGSISSGDVSGGQLLGSLTVDPTTTSAGTFKSFSLTTTVPNGSPALGENLSVRFLTGGFLPVQTNTGSDQIDFDNVTLSYHAADALTPEPSGLHILLTGLGSIWGVYALRRRRTLA